MMYRLQGQVNEKDGQLAICLGLVRHVSRHVGFVVLVEDVDECTTNSQGCDANAVCYNTVGSYKCTCKPGFEGDGKNCTGKYKFVKHMLTFKLHFMAR